MQTQAVNVVLVQFTSNDIPFAGGQVVNTPGTRVGDIVQGAWIGNLNNPSTDFSTIVEPVVSQNNQLIVHLSSLPNASTYNVLLYRIAGQLF